jgi:hypothetical protein
MTTSTQRGILLLPVTLTLAILGALAYSMTREGGMGVAAVNAQYDTEVARYLAEAGLSLARWQNEKRGCDRETGFGTVALPGGTIKSVDVDWRSGGFIAVSLTATSDGGAVRRIEDKLLPIFDRSEIRQASIGSGGGADTTIKVSGSNQSGSDYLETSDYKSHALISFAMPSELQRAELLSAELRLTKLESKSTQLERSLGVHRVTRDWSVGSATWTSPWSARGGDYVATPAATTIIDKNGEFNGVYTWRIDPLVDAWAKGTLPNQGLLLKPSGLVDTRFGSFERPSGKPQLVVRYYPRC